MKALQQLATRGDASPQANAISAAATLLLRVVQGVGACQGGRAGCAQGPRDIGHGMCASVYEQ